MNVKAGDLDVNAVGNITLANAVKVDAGATTIRTTTGNVTQTGTAGLTFVGGDASITADAGSISITKATVGGTGKADSLTLTGKNNVSLANATVEKDLTAKSTDKDVALDTVTVKGNAVVDADDNVTLDGAIAVDGTADITAKTGSITQNAGSTLTVVGNADVTAAAGAVTLEQGVTVGKAGTASDLTVTGAGNVSVKDADVEGAVALKSTGGSASLAKNAVGNTIEKGLTVDAATTATVEDTVVADGGADIDAAGKATVANVTVTKGNLTVDSTGNNVELKEVTVTAGDMALAAAGDVTLTDNITVDAGDTTVAAGGKIEQKQTTPGTGTLDLDGDVAMTAASDVTVVKADVEGSTVVNAGGDIDMSNADLGTDGALTGDYDHDVVLNATGDLTLKNVAVKNGGDADIDAGKTVALETVTVTGDAAVDAVNSASATDAITFKGTVTVNGDTAMHATTGDIVQANDSATPTPNPGVLNLTGDAAFVADAGAVTLDHEVNVTTGSLTVDGDSGVTVADATVTVGDMSLNSLNGNVTLKVTDAAANTVGGNLLALATSLAAGKGNVSVSDTAVTGTATVGAGRSATMTGVTVDGNAIVGAFLSDATLDNVTVGTPTKTSNLVVGSDFGDVVLDNAVAVTGNAEMEADKGNITQKTTGTLTVGGDVTMIADTSDGSPAGTITLVGTGANDIDGKLTAEAGSTITITSNDGTTDSALQVSKIRSEDGNVTVQATAITMDPVTGSISTEDQSGTTASTINLTATGSNTGIDGDIALTKVVAGNDDGTVNLNAAKDVEMYADGRTINEVRADTLNITAGGDVGATSATTGDLLTHVNNESLNVTGNATADNDQALTFSAATTTAGNNYVGGNLTQAVDGNLNQTAAVTVDKTTTLDVEGNISLTTGANDFGADGAATSVVNVDGEGTMDLVDVNDIIFNNVEVAGDTTVKAGATISQTTVASYGTDGHMEMQGQTDLQAVNGITLDNTINDFVGDVSARNTTTGNITLRDANDINLGDTVNGNGGVISTAVGGDIVVTTEDGDVVINNIAGYSVDSANNVTFTAKNNPLTVGDNGNVVQLGQAIAVAPNGDAQTVANAGLDTTSTKATGTLTMTTDGSVGGVKGADYIVTEAGTYVVNAGGDVDLVGLNGMDVTGLTAGSTADLYTDGTISTKNNGGQITTGGDVTVTAADYDRTVDMTMNGSMLTVNNIEGQPAKNAPFDLHGGNDHPEVTASRNEVTVFADGRYVGGERKNFYKLWNIESFQMLTPSIEVNYTVDDEGTITETTEGEE